MHPLRLVVPVLVVFAGGASAQTPGPPPTPSPRVPAAQATPGPTVAAPVVAADYVIGPDDVLSIVFWREKDMSSDVAVRPDGKISLPLIDEVSAAGLTPTELRERVTEAARRFVEDPNVSVVVRQINSRKVFVTGEVNKPGPYPLTGPTSILQMIATAGGLREYADSKHIVLMRLEHGRTVAYPFNYKDVANRRNLRQNIELRPGDTVVVP